LPSKYQIISSLVAEKAQEITSNADRYTAFLTTAANNYKYSFHEQLMIHAQKPTATACADVETWNKLGRWVNKGTKGIALLVERDVPYKLRHVFDISDTNSYYGRTISLWQMEPRYEDAVTEALENQFGELPQENSFVENLASFAGLVVDDNFSDYLSQLLSAKEGSLLEELDEFNTEVWLKSTLKSSVGFMLLTRCGIHAKYYYSSEDFNRIYDFNTPETISVLGSAGSDISEMILGEIAATVKSLQREEKKQVRTFAVDEHDRYDINVKSKNERSFDHGTDLQAGGRLSASEPDSAGIPESWEVWNAASKLPAQPPKRNLHRDDDQRQAEQSLRGDQPEGQRDDGVPDNTDGEVRGRDGEPESIGSDALGGDDEQYQESGRGSGNGGSDLQLSDTIPTEEEQQNIIAEAEAERASAFSISQEDIDAVVTRGSGVHHGKYRIYEQFLKKLTAADNIAFLKNEYGWGGAYPAVADREIDEMHDAKGIKISRGSISEPDASILLKWNKVEKRIGELIAADRYLNSAEEEQYPVYCRTQEERNARWEIGKEFQSIIRDYNDFQEQLGNTDAKLNQYVLINCGSEFGQGSKTTFTLSKNNFILPLMRDAMRTVIAENTHLTERCEAMLVSLDNDLAKPMEPTYDELNPPPEPEKEYRLSLGDTVYIGSQEYEVLSFDENEVCLYDTQFPLFNKVMPRAEFDSKLAENPMNDHLLQVVEDAEPEILVETNIGKVPIEDYREIVAIQHGFDSYDDLLRQGFHIGNGYDKAPENKSIEGSPDDEISAKKDYDDFDDVDPAAVREGLAKRGIVNGELIDPEALERDPFIQQVSADVERLSHPAPKSREKASPFLLHPEIPSTERSDYRIADDNIGVGLPHERYQHNVDAIKLLKKIESENRLATTLEQKILAQYVGWGGLADYFDERNVRCGELKELLTEDEYTAARESTLTAFYTPPVVIRAMYQALENINFKTGNILEPSCGVGNFIGMKPEHLSNSKIYGIELDSISGRIAQQLYQKSTIAVQGFEKTELPDSFFDVAIGNVPFGSFKVPDKKYNRYNFLIHDYFFARTLDKVRPGGIMAFITSKGTMDKENPSVRKYIAQRADLLGAIRLPNNTFKSAAGTEVTSDILFFQKRDRLIDAEPDWVHLNKDLNGLKMNQYFVDNPDMILGEMREVSGPFGPETACIAYPVQDLGEQLSDAIQNIHAEITEYELDDLIEEEADNAISADPDVRNFSYTVVDGKIYYRENSRMVPVDVSVTAESRINSMIAIRDCVRTLIEYQTEDYPDDMIADEQAKLNTLYNEFNEKYGRINSRANKSAFNSDSSFCLLSSLEVLDDDGNFIRKADMFSKRTIKQHVVVTSVDTASEALAVSLAEKASVDMPYMMELTGKSEQKIFEDLTGVIFLNPQHTGENDEKPKYLPADEYLSGNVREKREWAKRSAELFPEDYTANVIALEAVQPKDLSASEISVRLGATWLPANVVEAFMFDLFDTPRYCQWNIHVHYSQYTGEWNIEGKGYDRSNIMVSNTYGTDRINGYKIIEQTLNLKDVRIFDYIEDASGKKTPVLNKKETAIAQGKQELIKQAFTNWIWADPNRREQLCKLYNEKFNSVRPREYDGSHLSLVGINPEIALRQHQLNAVARGLYGGNELLGHVVGAGKTYTIVAIAQESKRLGLAQKSLIVVPNHLTEQWAAEYLQLYPSANILVATAKDFEAKNRKRFCGRIATGDYDAVIIGHSQLEKIPMSIERQRYILEQQMEEIMGGIIEIKANKGDRFSIKQLERSKKAVQVKLDKLNDQSRKDDLVTFEELGVDRLFIDEAHYYKNLAAFTKMRNVGGISQTEAIKSSDLYMKCRYLDELTGGRGVVFATGTPISNTMVEMYTMQKYLQYDTLRCNDLIHFDAWASTFGETVTAIELAPEGTGYRAKTRFAKFYNLPELMAMFKEVADIQTADMLNLPVPKANYHNVVLKPSVQQKEMVDGLADRAEKVRNRMVNSSEDNMLVITNDGRKLALDQRLMNELLPDSDTGKVSACADNVFEIWQRTKEQRSAQMVFCDLSTPHNDGHFNVYDALRDKLIAQGIPTDEIEYIHSAGTEAKKKELFGKVRSGQIRVIIGSTQKMGAGTNVQQRLIALHHLDCPWRPADLQQREGRIIRQGNENPEVEIFTYVTENTFDSYLYQLVESKQKFIGQIMTSNSPVRSAEDIDETALSYAEIKALCTGNPHIKEKMDLDIAVQKLKLLKANHLSQKYALEDQIIKDFPQRISSLEQRIEGYKSDMAHLTRHTQPNEDGFSPMKIEGTVYTEKKAAGSAILEGCHAMTSPDAVPLGQYRGFVMDLNFDSFSREYKITLKNELRHTTSIGTDIFGNIQRLDNLLSGFEDRLRTCEEELENSHTQLSNAKEQVNKPFPQEEELKTKSARLDELNIMLNMDKTENEIVDDERDEDEQDGHSTKEYER
jgi:N12 class adenine-specific DNA methylase/adenine-specific DNA methylase